MLLNMVAFDKQGWRFLTFAKADEIAVRAGCKLAAAEEIRAGGLNSSLGPTVGTWRR